MKKQPQNFPSQKIALHLLVTNYCHASRNIQFLISNPVGVDETSSH